MANSVDERIVSMKFDNDQFESGAKESMSTIDKLLAKLKLTDSAEGFSNLDKAAKGIDLSGIASGVDTAASKFNALETIAVGALLRIGNQVAELGINLVKSLSTDQIGAGFNEYEQKMGSVQTLLYNAKFDESIYTNDVKKMEKIKDIMEDLNKYSDDTIYSFGDMKSAIAKFVNAGVDLDDSALAIKGIANVAALSGANAQEAGRAYYNLAQSLSTGSLKLIDWKSIENANMASIPFKQTLIDVGREMGALSDDIGNIGGGLKAADVTAENFRQSIEGVRGNTWVTNEVLLAALAKFGDKTTEIGEKAYKAATEIKTFSMLMDTLKEAAQSGWAETFEIVIGDFFTAKDMWTKVSDEIGGIISSSTANRNNTLEYWLKNLGGRAQILTGIKNLWESIKTIVVFVKDELQNIFPEKAYTALSNFSRGFFLLTEKIRKEVVESKLGSTTWDTIKLLIKRIIPLFKLIKPVVSGIIDVFGALGRAIGKIAKAFGWLVIKSTDTGSEMKWIEETCKSITLWFGKLVAHIDSFSSWIAGFISTIKSNQYIDQFTNKVGELYDLLANNLKPILEKLNFDNLKKFFMNPEQYIPTKESLMSAITTTWDTVQKLFSGEVKIEDLFATPEGADPVPVDLNRLSKGTSQIKSFNDVLKELVDILEVVKNTLANFWKKLGETISNIDWILVTGLAMDAVLLYFIYRAMGWVNTIITMFSGLAGATAKFMNACTGVVNGLKKVFLSISNYINIASMSTSLVKLAVAFGLIAASLYFLSKVPTEDLERVDKVMFKYFIVLAGVFAVAAVAVSFLSKNSTDMQSAGNLFLGLALMVGIMAVALAYMSKEMSDSDLNNLGKVISGILSLTAVMVIFLLIVEIISTVGGRIDHFHNTAKVIVALSLFLGVMVHAMSKFVELGKDADNLMAGTAAFALLLIAISAFALSFLAIKDMDLLKIVGSLMAFAVAAYIFTKVLKSLSTEVNYAKLKKNWVSILVGFTVFCAYLVVTTRLIGHYGLSLAVAVAGIGVGLLAAAAAFYVLAKISDTDNIKLASIFVLSFLAFVIILTAVSNKLNKSFYGSNELALMLIAVAGSLILVAIAFRLIANMKVDKIIKGALAMIAPMGVLIFGIVQISKKAEDRHFKDMIGIVLSFAALIVVVTGALILLSVIPTERLIPAMISMFEVLGIFVALLGLLMFFSKDEYGDGINNAKGVILALAAFIAIFGLVVTAMSKLAEIGTLGYSLAALAVGLVMLGVILAVINKMKVKDMKKSIAAVVLAVVMLLALTASMAILGSGDLDWKGILAGTVGIIAILATITAVLSLFKGSRTKSILSAAAAMVIMSAAVAIIAASLFLLCQVDPNALTDVVIAIGLLMVLVTAVVYVLASMGTVVAASAAGFFALAGSLVALAGSMALIGLALILIVSSILVVGLGIASIGLGLIGLGIGLHSFTDEVIYFTSRVPELCENLALAVLAFYDFMQTLHEVGPQIALLMGSTATLMIAGFLYGISNGIPQIIDASFAIILSFINGLADAISSKSDELNQAMKKLHDAIVEAILKFFGMGSKTDSSSEMEDVGGGMIDGIVDGMKKRWEERHPVLSGIADGLGSIFKGAFTKSDKTNAFSGDSEEVKAIIAGAKSTGGGAGTSFATGYADGISNNGAVIKEAMSGVNELAAETAEDTKPNVTIMTEQDARIQAEQRKNGSDAMRSYTDGMEEYAEGEGSDRFGNFMDSFLDGGLSTKGLSEGFDINNLLDGNGLDLESFGDAGFESGEAWNGGFLDGLQNGGGSFSLDNIIPTNGSLSFSPDSLSGLFSEGSGTSEDPGHISVVTDLDSDNLMQQVQGVWDNTKFSDIFGTNVQGSFDSTYTSTAAEMAQQESMFERVAKILSGDFDASVKNMPVPNFQVDVNLNANAKQMFNMTQKQSMEYQKRTGKPAFG